MDISGTLLALRKQLGLSQAEVAEYVTKQGQPIVQTQVSKWEKGERVPDATNFLLLCQLYGVHDVLTVFCDASRADSALNDLGRQRLLEYMRLLQSSNRYVKAPSVVKRVRSLPLYDLPVSAGTGQFLDSDRYELIDVDDTVPDIATFAVRVSGDSMMPQFANQQVVYVRQQPTLEKGEIGIFIINGDAYCKLLGGDKSVELISINKRYAPIQVRADDELRIVGKVVG